MSKHYSGQKNKLHPRAGPGTMCRQLPKIAELFHSRIHAGFSGDAAASEEISFHSFHEKPPAQLSIEAHDDGAPSPSSDHA